MTLTWRHVSRGTGSGMPYLNQAEIAYLEGTIAGPEDVVGLQVAMDDCWVNRMQIFHRTSDIDLYSMDKIEIKLNKM